MTKSLETFEQTPNGIKINNQKLLNFIQEKWQDAKFVTLAQEKVQQYINDVNQKWWVVQDRLIKWGVIEGQIERYILEAKDELAEKSKLPLPKKVALKESWFASNPKVVELQPEKIDTSISGVFSKNGIKKTFEERKKYLDAQIAEL